MTTSTAAAAGTEPKPRVVVVDDDIGVLTAVCKILERHGCEVVEKIGDGKKAHDALIADTSIDVAVLDVMLPHVTGLEILRDMKARRPQLAIVMMTASNSVEMAVEAVKAGAFDYLSKPFDSLENVALTVKRACEHHRLIDRNRNLEQALEEKQGFEELVGGSPKMVDVFRMIQSVGPADAFVLVRGQSGTGKELVARAIHRRSERSKQPFLAVNCSAFNESTLESELFGHKKGAFTNAISDRKGLFEAAHKGTLFLDEIGDMPTEMQVKLLRVLQSGEVKPMGGNDIVKVDVRVVSATHVDLEAAIQKKTFRQDLFYRLNVLSIDIPPLAARPEDIVLLAHHFRTKYSEKSKKKIAGFTDAAVRALTTHDWPGNVRELENAIQRACVLCQGENIDVSHLPPGVGGSVSPVEVEAASVSHLPYAQAKKATLAAFEKAYLGAKLKASSGNISRAAREAGMDRSNFKRLLRDAGLTSDASMEGDAES